jgi:hypothetical protein
MKKFFIICAFIFAFNNLNAMEANDSNHHGYCQWPIIKHISNFFGLCEEKHEEKHDDKHNDKHYGDHEKSDAKKSDDGKEKKELDQKKDSPKESIQSEIKKIEGEINDKIQSYDKK